MEIAHAAQCQGNRQPNQKMGGWSNKHFSKKDIQMDNKPWKDIQYCSLFSSVQFSCSVASDSLLKNCKSKVQRGTTSHQSEWPSSKNL